MVGNGGGIKLQPLLGGPCKPSIETGATVSQIKSLIGATNTVLNSLTIRKTNEKSTSSGKLPVGISCPND